LLVIGFISVSATISSSRWSPRRAAAGSGHLGRLDRKTGTFTFWDLPGAKFFGTGKETGSTEYP